MNSKEEAYTDDTNMNSHIPQDEIGNKFCTTDVVERKSNAGNGNLLKTCLASEDVFQIIIDRVRAVTIRALLSIEGIFTKAIVDTGAEVTVLSERLYNMIPEDKRPKLKEAKRGLVVAEAGREMGTCGVMDANFKLGDFEFKYGLFEYSVMPFGLCNAPSTLKRCMELVFRGLQWDILLVYLDDIIVIGSNFEEHMERLEEVFKRLFRAGLKMKPSKCELFRSEVLFLGHIVSQDGIQPNPETVEKVLSWKVPCTVKEIQSFLGLCSYYRQYIQNFSHIAAPLIQLTKKNVQFVWDESCQAAFEILKKKLCSAPVLAYPKPGLRYILDTDASDVGVSGVLSQIQDGKERVIAYASKKLNVQQTKIQCH